MINWKQRMGSDTYRWMIYVTRKKKIYPGDLLFLWAQVMGNTGKEKTFSINHGSLKRKPWIT